MFSCLLITYCGPGVAQSGSHALACDPRTCLWYTDSVSLWEELKPETLRECPGLRRWKWSSQDPSQPLGLSAPMPSML